MTVETTKNAMLRYLNSEHGDLSMMAEDVVFTMMGTGQENRGREAVRGMLQYFYQVAFDARAESRVTVYGENAAIFEGNFVGKHIAEFAGVPATGRSVRVPICVVYELEAGIIKHGRIYFEMSVLMAQITET